MNNQIDENQNNHLICWEICQDGFYQTPQSVYVVLNYMFTIRSKIQLQSAGVEEGRKQL